MKSKLSRAGYGMIALGVVMLILGSGPDLVNRYATGYGSLKTIAKVALAQTGPVIEMEKSLEVKAPRLTAMTIKSTAKDLWWEVIPPGDFDVFREYDPDTSVIKLRLMAYKNGTFYLVVGGALGDKASVSKCKITVTAFDPVPPPPVPPPPKPKPEPDDPLLLKLQAAYGSSTDPQKLVCKAQLSSLYVHGASLLKDKTLANWGNVFEGMAKKAQELGVSGKLPEVQGILQVELKANLPTKSDVLLTDANRQTGIELFTRISSLLDQVK